MARASGARPTSTIPWRRSLKQDRTSQAKHSHGQHQRLELEPHPKWRSGPPSFVEVARWELVPARAIGRRCHRRGVLEYE